MNYVAGFMFSPDGTRVALIRKLKPEWQKNKLNAIGGKIEEFDQNEFDAMVREFEEETGVVTEQDEWKHFASIAGNDYKVSFFVTFSDKIDVTRSMEAEEVLTFDVEDLKMRLDTVPNLSWLIPLALDKSVHANVQEVA